MAAATAALSHQLSSSASLKGSNNTNALLSAGARRVAHIPFTLGKNFSSTSVQPIKCSFGKVVSPIADLLEDVANGLVPISQPDQVKRKDFPSDFVFGASTSTSQPVYSFYN